VLEQKVKEGGLLWKDEKSFGNPIKIPQEVTMTKKTEIKNSQKKETVLYFQWTDDNDRAYWVHFSENGRLLEYGSLDICHGGKTRPVHRELFTDKVVSRSTPDDRNYKMLDPDYFQTMLYHLEPTKDYEEELT
jgi:hypothetical protein